jgi:uncharacterized metal-binding protein
MASGKVHDASTLMMAPVVYWFWTTVLMLPVSCGVWSAVGVIFGGLYLSPDLDTPSRPYFRWGFLRWIWKPYQWAAKHRSVLSHSVFLGPMLRLAILGSIMILGWAVWVNLFHPWLLDQAWWGEWIRSPWIRYISRIWNDGSHALHKNDWLHPRQIYHLLLGAWFGMVLHLVLDCIWDWKNRYFPVR